MLDEEIIELFFTVEAMDLIRRASTFGWVMPSNSITFTFNLSNSFGSSIFSLKDREKSFPVCFNVVSLILIWFIVFSPFISENKKALEIF